VPEKKSEPEPEPQVVEVPSLVHEREIGAPRVFVTASFDWLLDGYSAACARFQGAADSRLEAKETFVPLFEALNWAASMELFLTERNSRLEDDLVRAFGYARNRVHHQWAAALDAKETPVEASAGVFEGATSTLAGVSVEWFWKLMDDLPPAERPDPAGEAAYPKLLAGKSVRPTLRDLQALFETRL
jgi:hypothetical protein